MQTDDSSAFWGEIAPCEHVVQIHDRDDVFLDTLEGFVSGGLSAGEGVIAIATPAHLQALQTRLLARGIDADAAQASDQYIALNCEEALERFMVNGWPDDERFECMVVELVGRAKRNRVRVRAFGEMVALLWASGHNGATVRLEHLWHRVVQNQGFSLFCAYPRIGFTQDAADSMREICDLHSRIV